MKLYEHEAKAIVASYGVPTPKGELADNPQQVRDAAERLRVPVAIKAQVLVAGRGKAGGILFAQTPEEAEKVAAGLFGAKIRDSPFAKVIVEEQVSVKKELYFGLTVDRSNRCYVAVASQMGGVDIEEVASSEPKRILRKQISPRLGFCEFHSRALAKELGYSGEQLHQMTTILQNAYKAAMDYDALLMELNPLVETQNGQFVAVDARLILDGNSLFRHEDFRRKQLEEQRDLSLEEFEALKSGLEYVKMDGEIGVVGNGAGLVMATLDMITLYGGRPANFLDIGGGAPPQRIETALRIVLSNPQVKVVFVNILGGITLCDEVAHGIIQARQKLSASKPMLIRLVGTNEAEGKRILNAAKIPFFESMEEAAAEAVHLAKETP